MSNELIEIALDPQIRKNPKQIACAIIDLGEKIELCKNDLTEIKNRGFWDKLVSSNTKDLANAMLKQNDTISFFLTIVQNLIMMNMVNTVMLGKIQEELNIQEKSRGKFQNKYVLMAKEYIDESYSAAITLKGRIEDNSERITEIKKRLIEKNRLDEEQSKLIDEIKREITEKNVTDEKQNKNIAALKQLIINLEKKAKHSSSAVQLARQDAMTMSIQNRNSIKKFIYSVAAFSIISTIILVVLLIKTFS